MTGGQIGFALGKVWRAALVIFVLRCLSIALVGVIPTVLLGVLSTIAEVLVNLFVAIFFHRLYLLGDREYRYYRGIYGRFLMMMVILNFALYSLSVVQNTFVQNTGQIPGPVMIANFVVMAVSAVIWCRLLVVFPATAIGQKRGLGWAWKLTNKYGWAIFGGWCVFFLILIPFALIVAAAYFALDLPLQPVFELDWRLAMFQFFGAFLTVLTAGAAAVYASSIYKQLISLTGNDSSPPNPAK